MPNFDDEMTSELIQLLVEKNNALKQKLADYNVANTWIIEFTVDTVIR